MNNDYYKKLCNEMLKCKSEEEKIIKIGEMTKEEGLRLGKACKRLAQKALLIGYTLEIENAKKEKS